MRYFSTAVLVTMMVFGGAHGALAEDVSKAEQKAEKKAEARARSLLSRTLVKVSVTSSAADPLVPWQRLDTESGSGSGVIIAGQRILTNAHIVADQVSIDVKRNGMTRTFDATVEVVGHECDLAILKVADEKFFEGAGFMELGSLPSRHDHTDAFGFPLGGESASVTSGVVSRIEVGEYIHSERDLLLVQLDAALNPGNSGGPVVNNEKLAGIAMQGLDGEDVENVGYFIPAPVIRHFLEDVADGSFDGFPGMGIDSQHIANPAMKQRLGMTDEQAGVLVTRVSSGASADGLLAPGDVILSIDGHDVAEDGTVKIGNDLRVNHEYLVTSRQVGEELGLKILRDGKKRDIKMKLSGHASLVAGPLYDKSPDYLVFGGVVFQSVSVDYIGMIDDSEYWEHLAYYDWWHDLRTEDRRELIVVSQVLRVKLNRGYDDWDRSIVDTVMGKRPRDLKELAELIDNATGDYFEVTSEDGLRMVLDLERARLAGPSILERYGVPAARSAGLESGAPVKGG
jgi:S1-C subfamily serine protease